MRRKQTASLSLHPCLHLSVIPRLWSSLNQTYIYRSCYNGPLTCISLPLFLPIHPLPLPTLICYYLNMSDLIFSSPPFVSSGGRGGLGLFFFHTERSHQTDTCMHQKFSDGLIWNGYFSWLWVWKIAYTPQTYWFARHFWRPMSHWSWNLQVNPSSLHSHPIHLHLDLLLSDLFEKAVWNYEWRRMRKLCMCSSVCVC